MRVPGDNFSKMRFWFRTHIWFIFWVVVLAFQLLDALISCDCFDDDAEEERDVLPALFDASLDALNETPLNGDFCHRRFGRTCNGNMLHTIVGALCTVQ